MRYEIVSEFSSDEKRINALLKKFKDKLPGTAIVKKINDKYYIRIETVAYYKDICSRLMKYHDFMYVGFLEVK